MSALSPTAPAANHDGPPHPGSHRVWLLTALVAGLFSLVVSGAMVFDRFRIAAGDPLKSAQMTALKEKLAAAPMDEQLKTQIRELDLRLRRHYFDHLSLNNAGAWLLLVGLVVCVLSAKRAFQVRKRPHLPQPRPEATDETARLATWARWGVGVAGGVVGAGLLTLLLTASTALPSRPAELAKLLGSADGDSESAADLLAPTALEAIWPRFRGWDGNGVATSTNVPLQWDVASGAGVLWKTPVPSPGFNSPIVCGNRVFLSGAEAEKREVFCFDAESGQILWQRPVQNVPGSPAKLPEIPESTGFAAATMASDGRRVYAIFGNGDLAAFTLEGAPVWSKNIGVPKNAHGHAASLLTWQGRLIIQLDQGEGAGGLSRLYALDGATGREVWQRSRPVPSSWATPIIIEAAGKTQFITLGVPWVIAYSAADGNELWRAEMLDGEVTPSPIFAGGFVFVVSPNIKLAALRPDGQGDVSKTHVAWFAEDNVPDITSPVGNSELVFTLSTSGLLTCYDVKEGKKQWEQDFVMECHASPTIVGNRLYAITTKGTVIVVEVARQFKELARMEMGEKIFASPAIVGGRIFIRGAKHLFCIGAKEAKLADSSTGSHDGRFSELLVVLERAVGRLTPHLGPLPIEGTGRRVRRPELIVGLSPRSHGLGLIVEQPAKAAPRTTTFRVSRTALRAPSPLGAERLVVPEPDVGLLTPHPGPLPVEGRGRRAGRPELMEDVSPRSHGLGLIVEQPAKAAPRTTTLRVSHDALRAPSPLNGERAGVRGEAIQSASFHRRSFHRDPGLAELFQQAFARTGTRS